MNKIKIFRWIMTLIISFALTLSSSLTSVNASSKYRYRPIKDLASLKYVDSLSYDEMLAHLISSDYSPEEILEFQNSYNQVAGKEYAQSTLQTSSTFSGTEIRFSLFSMTTYSYKYGLWSTCKVQARFSVGLEYDRGASSPNRIVSIAGQHAYTGAGDLCVFSGTIFYQLEAGNRFYYSLFGNLHKKGEVNRNVGVSIGVGSFASVSGSISNGGEFIRNISESETYLSLGLEP